MTAASEPLVSVIVPTFNRRDLVVKTIQSVLRQTYSRYEILVQDDGSTDGTAEVVAKLSGPISYEYQSNRGLAAARNAAIRRSRGELIAPLDSDDTWRPTMLERCVAHLQQHSEHDGVCTIRATEDIDGHTLEGHDKHYRTTWTVDDVFEESFLHESASVFWRRVWERIGGFDESLPVCVGHNFWLRVAVEHTFGFIPEPLAVRTWLPDSLTRGDRVGVQKTRAAMLTRFLNEQGERVGLDLERAHRSLARVNYSVAKVCGRHGDYDSALQHLQQALALQPDHNKARWYHRWVSLQQWMASFQQASRRRSA